MGADTVVGNAGNDSISTSGAPWTANDAAAAKPGVDHFNGGPGDDTFLLSWNRRERRKRR